MTAKYLVVLGLDPDKKARAARFDLVDAAAVRKVAAERGLKVGTPKNREAEVLAAKLPDGKIYLSGKGLVPFVRGDIYAKLERGLEFEALVSPSKDGAPAAKGTLEASAGGQGASAALPGNAPKAQSGAAAATSRTADAWAAIGVGSVILVQDKEAPPNRAWWEATVTAIAKDGTLTAKWSSFPALKPFTVRRSLVAILPAKT